MVYLRKQNPCCSVAWIATLLSIVVVSNVRGAEIGCGPPTPCPCEADGVCVPNRLGYGRYPTRWRPWPGDPQPELPTLDLDQAAEGELKLDALEHPTPEKEDNRSPAKTKSFKSVEEESSSAPALEEDSPLAPPEGDLFPGLDDQGSSRVMPLKEDAPPELPRSLRRFVISTRGAQFPQPQTAQPPQFGDSALIAPEVGSRQSSNLPGNRLHRLVPEPTSAMMQVAAEPRIVSSSVR